MVQVQRGHLPTSSTLLCPECGPPDDEEAAAVVAEAVAAGQVAVCTEQWLQGVRLDADGQQWLCWVERPYSGPGFEDKVGKNFRWCTRLGCVRALSHTQIGHRSKLPRCVERKIEEVHGALACRGQPIAPTPPSPPCRQADRCNMGAQRLSQERQGGSEGEAGEVRA